MLQKVNAALPDGIPPDWTKKAHHMTVQANEEDFNKPGGPPRGSAVALVVSHVVANKRAIAVVVRPTRQLSIKNKNPHITVAVAPGIQPSYSNELLTVAEWQPMQPFMLRSWLLDVFHDQTKTAPQMHDLAKP